MDSDASPSGPLPRSMQPLFASAVAVGLVGIAVWLAFTGRHGLVDHDAPPAVPVRFTVDINKADADELSQLPGLGPMIAARIVAHRDTHGPFSTPDALLAVPGIGEATLAAMRPHLRPLSKP
jgi:competence ComEA-like helix-hairpin-helix protein